MENTKSTVQNKTTENHHSFSGNGATRAMPAVPVLQKAEADEALQPEKPIVQKVGTEKEPLQTKPNNTGLPDNLKSGVENLSGYSMDDVKVHYNSDKPAQLQALAYTQGTGIHVAPGQEQHLPHEAWHVVQQMQGRVQPTMQMKEGVAVNDNKGLESEADVMGGKAVQMNTKEDVSRAIANLVVQKKSNVKQGFGFEDNRNKCIFQLQIKSYGNTQIRQNNLYRANFSSNHSEPIQRILGNATNTLNGNELASLMEYVGMLNIAVEKAYKLLTSLAFLKISGDPYMQKFKDYWINWEILRPEEQGLMAARAGYWIESYATLLEVPEGKKGKLSWKYQVINGKTRPDVEVSYDDNIISYLDITSEGSRGHIYKKAGNLWIGNGYINEIMYPQIDFGSMRNQYQKGIIPDSDDDICLLSAEYEKNKNEASARQAEFASVISELISPLLGTTDSPTCNMKEKGIGPRRDACIKAIGKYFNENYTPIQVGQILSYAGLNRETYAITTGNGNASEGERLLKNKTPQGAG
jgi:hypothetical protein